MPSRVRHPQEAAEIELREEIKIIATELKRVRDDLDETQAMIDTLKRLFDEEKLSQRLDMRRLRELLKPLAEF